MAALFAAPSRKVDLRQLYFNAPAPPKSLQAPKQTLAGYVNDTVTGLGRKAGLSKLMAKRVATLADMSAVGNVASAFDSGTQIRGGDWLGGGLGALLAIAPVPGPKGMRNWLGKKPFFHGTSDLSFDPAKLNLDLTRRGNYGRGLYVSSRPDIASSYAGQTGAVYPLQIADNARVLDLTTPEGRQVYDSLKSNEDALRSQFDVIRAPGESVILNRGVVKSVFDH